MSSDLSGLDLFIFQDLDCPAGDAAEGACQSGEAAFRVRGSFSETNPGEASSRWWTWTPPRTGWATLCLRSESSSMQLILSDETGTLLSPLQDSPNASTINYALELTEPIPILIELRGSGERAEDVGFDLTAVVRPINDDFQRRTEIDVLNSPIVEGHNFYATEEPQESTHAIGSAARDPGHDTVWWTFTAPENVEAMTVETLSYDFASERAPAIAIYQGSDFPSEDQLLASNFSGNRNRFAFNVSQGQSYLVAVDGLKPYDNLDALSAFGSFSFAIRPVDTPPNDSFQTPLELSPDSEPQTATAGNATKEPEGDPFMGSSAGNSSLWWFWDAPNYPLEVTGDIESISGISPGTPNVTIIRRANQELLIQINDDQGQQWELLTTSPDLRAHQREGIEILKSILPGSNGILSEPQAEINEIKSLAAQILGFRRCLSVDAKGADTDDRRIETMVTVFENPVSKESDAIAQSSDKLTFCVGLNAQRYLFGFDHKLWENPQTVEVSLDWAATRPSNDDFVWAEPLLTNVPMTGNNQAATEEPFDPGRPDFRGANSIWWTWEAPQSGNFRLATQTTEFPDDLLVTVFEQDESNQLNLLSRNSQIADPSPSRSYPALSDLVTFRAKAKQTYFILVQGFEDAGGEVQLLLTAAPAPLNDDIRHATPITSDRIQGNNHAATSEPNEPAHGTAYPGQTLWWTWVASNNGLVTIENRNTDQQTEQSPKPMIAVYRGPDELPESPFEALTAVSSNHVRSREFAESAVFIAERNTRYYVAVNSRNGQTGNIDLAWNLIDGQILKNPSVNEGHLQFQVAITPELAPRFQILHSADLETWERLEAVYETVAGSTTVEIEITDLGANHFFRAIEATEP